MKISTRNSVDKTEFDMEASSWIKMLCGNIRVAVNTCSLINNIVAAVV